MPAIGRSDDRIEIFGAGGRKGRAKLGGLRYGDSFRTGDVHTRFSRTGDLVKSLVKNQNVSLLGTPAFQRDRASVDGLSKRRDESRRLTLFGNQRLGA